MFFCTFSKAIYHYVVRNDSVPWEEFLESILKFPHLLIRGLARGGSGVKKRSLASIKVQHVMESLLFMESQNLRLWRKYDASKFGGIGNSHTKYRGIKWPKAAIFDQYFLEYLSLSDQTCPKVRFYQVLHVSVSFVCRNVQILKIVIVNKNSNLIER